MKRSSYVMIALVILVTSAPTLVLAQYVNGGGVDQGTAMMILTIFSLTLYITISAIIGVVGYSVWQAFKIRSKAIKRSA